MYNVNEQQTKSREKEAQFLKICYLCGCSSHQTSPLLDATCERCGKQTNILVNSATSKAIIGDKEAYLYQYSDIWQHVGIENVIDPFELARWIEKSRILDEAGFKAWGFLSENAIIDILEAFDFSDFYDQVVLNATVFFAFYKLGLINAPEDWAETHDFEIIPNTQAKEFLYDVWESFLEWVEENPILYKEGIYFVDKNLNLEFICDENISYPWCSSNSIEIKYPELQCCANGNDLVLRELPTNIFTALFDYYISLYKF